ncbi:hypothetical protein XELAEV_18003919mg [Xenopus laevis]|uniref:Uncharacterized protein n=1 Tax=Xenopus laevis TaxID=8355 RepID=A0A974BN53_XENLA|nr:hypothetical protein XELAEV_18003919mg [Xenopus laevis]
MAGLHYSSAASTCFLPQLGVTVHSSSCLCVSTAACTFLFPRQSTAPLCAGHRTFLLHSYGGPACSLGGALWDTGSLGFTNLC